MTSMHLVSAILLVASLAVIQSAPGNMNKAKPMNVGPARVQTEGRLPPLSGATGWLNSPPLTPAALQGKVVLVEFWTYTCINWLRTLPYVRDWAARYKDQGLVVIGVHSPEFPFEHSVENVRRAVKAMRIDYPIALDSDFAVWRAFGNEYWPAIYVIDAQGRIRHHHFGEGGYEKSEQVIQQLLAEAGHPPPGREPTKVVGAGIEAPADWGSLESPESYLGAARAEGFASPGSALVGQARAYSVPQRLGLNQWALSGTWTITPGTALLDKAGGRIVMRFHARDLHLVMSPGAGTGPARFRVLLDGRPPGSAHGLDVDAQGNGTLSEQRLYQLVRQTPPIVDRQFEIEFLNSGAEAFAFTFG